MPRAKAIQKQNVPQNDSDEDSLEADDRNDKRKYNRGASQRRSYTKEEKLAVINMRDSGMTYDDIAKQTGYSRVNMEKWCSQKGRESIELKASKLVARVGGSSGSTVGPPSKRVKPPPAAEAEAEPIERASVQHNKVTRRSTEQAKHEASSSSSSSSSVMFQSRPEEVLESENKRVRRSDPVLAPPPALIPTHSRDTRAAGTRQQYAIISQPIQAGSAGNFDSSSDEDGSGDRSEEECDGLLQLVMKEQTRDRRQAQAALLAAAEAAKQQASSPRPGRGGKVGGGKGRSRGGSSAPAAVLPPADTGYIPHKHKPDPVSAVIPKVVMDREFVRVHHTQFASDITMSISDTMLKPDFSVLANGAPGIGMTTTLQATRPVLSNTKFFHMLREDRKKKDKLEQRARGDGSKNVVAADGSESSTIPCVMPKTKRRVLDQLCNSDSEQDKEDSAMLTLLGE